MSSSKCYNKTLLRKINMAVSLKIKKKTFKNNKRSDPKRYKFIKILKKKRELQTETTFSYAKLQE